MELCPACRAPLRLRVNRQYRLKQDRGTYVPMQPLILVDYKYYECAKCGAREAPEPIAAFRHGWPYCSKCGYLYDPALPHACYQTRGNQRCYGDVPDEWLLPEERDTTVDGGK